MADVILGGDGWIVALASVFIDETYDDQQDVPLLSVAGYLFRKQRWREFHRDWANYLRMKGLPYFHMSDCAHGNGIFAGRDDCLEVEKKLIALTRERTEFGFAITIDQNEYSEIMVGIDGMPQSAYAFLLMAAIQKVRKWTESTGFKGEIAYFFEEGYRHKPEADRFISWVFESPRIRQHSKYAGHAFVKKETPGLHPADMLAWQWGVEVKRSLLPKRRAARKDFEALIRDQDFSSNYDRAALISLHLAMSESQRQRRQIIQDVQDGVAELPDLAAD